MGSKEAKAQTQTQSPDAQAQAIAQARAQAIAETIAYAQEEVRKANTRTTDNAWDVVRTIKGRCRIRKHNGSAIIAGVISEHASKAEAQAALDAVRLENRARTALAVRMNNALPPANVA